LTSTSGVTPPANAKVHMCRRVKDSGTEAQAEVFFNNNPCGSAAKILGDNTTASNDTDGSQAALNLSPTPASQMASHEYQASGGVTGCLNGLQDANMWAIGIQSTEKSSAKFRFVKIDGAAPTLKNVADNNYLDAFTSTMQWRVAPGTNLPTADQLKVLNKMRDDASKASILAQINSSFSQPNMGPVGILALPYKPTSVANPVFSTANPVATVSREGATGASAPDSCKTPIIVKNSVISKAL
jgi:hypothetical protein